MRDDEWALLTELRRHDYNHTSRGSRPTDPGWHPCSCGWEGYWCDFLPHVASWVAELAQSERDDLRRLVQSLGRMHQQAGDEADRLRRQLADAEARIAATKVKLVALAVLAADGSTARSVLRAYAEDARAALASPANDQAGGAG